MANEITVEDAAAVISSAFLPLRCVAEPWDARFRVRFRVFNESDDPILRAEDLTRPQVTNPRRLEGIINQARNRLIDRGYELETWVYLDRNSGAA